MLGLVLVLVLLILVSSTETDARVEKIDVRKEFDNSDYVLLVEIENEVELKQDSKRCGSYYRAFVHEKIKSADPDMNYISFGRDEGLRAGRKYLLFFRRVTSENREYDRIKKQYNLPDETSDQKKETMKLVKCTKIIPGFVFDPRTAWEVKLGYVFVPGLRPNLPKSIRVFQGESLQWLIRKDNLVSYLRTLR